MNSIVGFISAVMMRPFILGIFLLAINLNCFSQNLLLFKKNNRREAYYKTGDIVSFNLKGSKQKISDQIRGFEDDVLIFQFYKVNINEISHLYVDDKTKIWFILRYKYEKLFLIAGAGFLPIDIINTGEIHQEALLVSGTLLGAGLLSKWLISKKMKVKGRRKLIILNYQ